MALSGRLLAFVGANAERSASAPPDTVTSG